MLWNLIYDFFIEHIFGGYLLNGNIKNAYFGYVNSGSFTGRIYTHEVFFSLFGFNISLGNYLSLIATIITMVIIVTLCALFIWKIIKLVGGLIR